MHYQVLELNSCQLSDVRQGNALGAGMDTDDYDFLCAPCSSLLKPPVRNPALSAASGPAEPQG
jgi:hypothetical protein